VRSKAEFFQLKGASLYKKLLILVLMVGAILAAYRFQQYSKLLIDPRRSFLHFLLFFLINIMVVFVLVFITVFIIIYC